MMNPPFTANDKKGRKFTPEVVKALQRRELQIRNRLAASDAEAAGVIDANSIQTMFIPLAEKVLVQDQAVFATVMPVTVLYGCISPPAAAVPRVTVPHRHDRVQS